MQIAAAAHSPVAVMGKNPSSKIAATVAAVRLYMNQNNRLHRLMVAIRHHRRYHHHHHEIQMMMTGLIWTQLHEVHHHHHHQVQVPPAVVPGWTEC